MYSSVTHIFSERDRIAVTDHIETHAAQSRSPHWTPGWPNEIEAALLDSVFSARAPYGGPETGVRRVVLRWREHRAAERLDDLGAFDAFAERPEDLAEILGNRQRIAGNATTKAEAVIRVAAALARFRISSADELRHSEDELEEVVTAVPGIGPKTWEAFMFLVGHRGFETLLHFIEFASDAVGRRLEGEVTEMLLAASADRMGVELEVLEHAVWRYQRRIPLPTTAAPRREAG